MADPFMSEIRPFAFDFAPKGWAWCDGQLLAISQNQALFSLLDTQYGGDGRTNFKLPDLRSRVPVGIGNGYDAGMTAGVEQVTLTTAEIPAHSHLLTATTDDGVNPPIFTNRVFSRAVDAPGKGDPNIYGAATNLTAFAENMVLNTGGNLPHTNVQPTAAINFCIALVGVFPSRN
ncbi:MULTISPECIES: phage tail protein [Pseudoalteromonas]|uniref:Tail fiber protein n=1 Tax=Pseudoalteromonas haloplanktis TaxID=228 RepID=A0ABU1BA92_PSEHA|nr:MULTISPECIES: tail fiber protein [Pseudoalteromonas]MCF6143555.1 hypothetical protein [Pseudoalteromonas mariniglutinosa NCIMB 1770]MDQ9091265.1 tail fiber protein [Pseudoalteromonas haloplanktis]TMN71504.1 microcystin-dependent protein [Pseudoalteromonas sp. S1727]